MVHVLRRGENVSIPSLSPTTTRVELGVGWEVGVAATGVGADLFAVLVGADGRVVSDAHLVFYNTTASPEGAVRLSGRLEGERGDDRQRLVVDLAGMPPEVERVVVAVALDITEATLDALDDLRLRVLDAPSDGPLGEELVRYVPDVDLSIADAAVLVEVYRYDAEWKVVAVGQAYASGLRGVVTEYGVHV